MTSNEPIFPNPDTLNEMEYGKFVLANLAARRATQIKAGAPPLVRIESNNPLSIALAEIAAGKIKPIMGGQDTAAMEESEELMGLDLGGEGLLLPGIDDEALSGLGLEDLDEMEIEGELDDETLAVDDDSSSITDMLDDSDESDSSDDTEMSLDDLASQEEGDDEEEPEA